MKKIGVILSGCGFLDGSEIHESVATLLAIDKAGAQAICMAPNISFDEINHLNKEPTGKKRNVLEESARICRGDIKDLKDVKASDFDALILPGGYGAVKNLSDFAFKGTDAKVQPEVDRLVKETIAAKKPLGAICIAPATIAVILGKSISPTLTIGNDEGTAQALEKLGCKHQNCEVQNIVIDEKNKIVTTPAFMLTKRVSEAFEGIEKLVKEVIRLC